MTYEITAENSKEIRERMKDKNNQRFFKRLQAVALRGEGKKNDEIGAITGYNPAYVSALVAIFCNEGIESLCSDKRKGGNHKNLTDEEEKAFLSRFEEAAKQGKVTDIAEIAAAYDELTGKNTNHVQQYTIC